MTLARLTALLIFVALPQVGERAAEAAATPTVQDPAADAAVAAWRAALATDASVGFAPITLGAARAALEDEALEPADRAAALVALGTVGGQAERVQIEAWVERGDALERRAALLALGELKGGRSGLPRVHASDADPELAQCALLALLRSRTDAGRARVRAVAERKDEPLAQAARDLLGFHQNPATSRPSFAAELLLELRFRAAQRYGLVGGKTYRVSLIDALGRDEEFLDHFIYRAATRVRRPGVRDHYLGCVLEERDEHSLRAAMEVLPTEVAQVVGAGIWVPDEQEWSILLNVIEERGVEALAEPLLERALTIEGLQGWAALLLLRGGNLRGRPVLEQALAEADAEQKRRAVEGLGASGNDGFLGWLATFAEDPDPYIRGTALVAQARLGHEGAQATLDILLANEALAQRQVPIEVLVDVLARAGDSAVCVDLLARSLPSLSGRPRMVAATALAAAGRIEGTEIVRDALRAVPPAGEVGASNLRALLALPTQESLALVRDLFPRGDDVDVDVELALALLDARDPSVRVLLRAAIWRGPFHRSVLAAALFADTVGLDMLRVEVENPPRSARPGDVRRVGFALGEWGGLDQVEALAARAGAGDAGLQGALLGALSARTQ